MSVRSKSLTTAVVRVSYDIRVSVDQAVQLCRPEVLWLQQHPWTHLFSNWTVLESCAPGDVVCSYQPVGLLALYEDLFSQKGSNGANKGQTVCRAVLQRDFPKEGEASLAIVELSGRSDCLCDVGVVISRTSDESVSHIQEVFESPNMPDWILHLLFRQFRSIACTPVSWETAMLAYSPVLAEQCGFTVVSLKKFGKGGPMVPRFTQKEDPSDEEFQWSVWGDFESFTLRAYLQCVLSLYGIDSSEIFDSLDGRRVVYWQAVVRTSTWSRLWCVLQPLFKEQAAAYRRHHGGTQAPVLRADTPPRFREEPIDFARLQCGPLETIGDERPLPVKNTFVHFDENDSDEFYDTYDTLSLCSSIIH